jgi:hypothetical protein
VIFSVSDDGIGILADVGFEKLKFVGRAVGDESGGASSKGS